MSKLWLRGKNYEYIDLSGDRNIMAFRFKPDPDTPADWPLNKYAIRIVYTRYKNGRIKTCETLNIEDDNQLDRVIQTLVTAKNAKPAFPKKFNRFAEIDMV
jgi:hypothetical protein